MKKTVVIVGGSAGAIISAEIFTKQYRETLFLETYAEGIDKKRIIAEKISDGLVYINKNKADYFIATGDNKQRKENFDILFNDTKKFPVNCIHPSAYISPSSKIGYGNLICPFSVIHTEAIIGNNTIINTGTIIEHTCVIADYAQISPNATLCGYVQVGEYSFIGAGSVVIPKIKIGSNSVIAAGSSVIDDIGNGKMYAGVPAKFKKKL